MYESSRHHQAVKQPPAAAVAAVAVSGRHPAAAAANDRRTKYPGQPATVSLLVCAFFALNQEWTNFSAHWPHGTYLGSSTRKLWFWAVQLLCNFYVFSGLHNFAVERNFRATSAIFVSLRWHACKLRLQYMIFCAVTDACKLWLLYGMFNQYKSWPVFSTLAAITTHALRHNSLIKNWKSQIAARYS